MDPFMNWGLLHFPMYNKTTLSTLSTHDVHSHAWFASDTWARRCVVSVFSGSCTMTISIEKHICTITHECVSIFYYYKVLSLRVDTYRLTARVLRAGENKKSEVFFTTYFPLLSPSTSRVIVYYFIGPEIPRRGTSTREVIIYIHRYIVIIWIV